MPAKRFPLFVIPVMLIGVSACDNVSFEGVSVDLRPPPVPEGMAEGDTVVEVEEEAPLLPVELGPLVYLVERVDGADARILAVAEITEDGFSALPDQEDIPDLNERFELDRWENGAEFSLLAHGGRVGTFVANGGTETDASTCLTRPRSAGTLELRPDVAADRWFLARPEGSGPAVPDSLRGTLVAHPPVGVDAAVTSAALNVAQRLIPSLGVPWPPSIPGARRDLQAFGLTGPQGVGNAFAASHVFGGQLGTGTSSPNGYGFFFIATEGETRYDPVVSWYQRAEWGKAFPRFLGAHPLRAPMEPDAILEVFGTNDRWLAILGPDDDGQWEMLYQDACGQEPARGAIQSYP